MERFWRTLREGCLNFLGAATSLADINARLRAFLDKRYHLAPHAGLLGQAPAKVYALKPAGEGALDEKALREALTVRRHRRVSKTASFPSTATRGRPTRATLPAGSSPSRNAS